MSVSIRMGEFFSGWVFQLERVGSSSLGGCFNDQITGGFFSRGECFNDQITRGFFSRGGCFNDQITGGFFSRGGCFNDQQVRPSLGVGISMIKGQVRFSLRGCLFQ